MRAWTNHKLSEAPTDRSHAMTGTDKVQIHGNTERRGCGLQLMASVICGSQIKMKSCWLIEHARAQTRPTRP
jgi:hypothetical protein